MKLSDKINLSRIENEIIDLFNLADDKADDDNIDQTLRANIKMKGTNLWVLIFAVFIASIGLNVNSTATVIGAMLISPLMGPLMGIGYGIGIYDFDLVRDSLKHLAIAASISLITSTIYFLLSPLTQVQSELLARTAPTIWDVLIAIFGGLAGIIAVTRKEKSNVIPGVAIATALMPPLCTAGYGLANGYWSFFGGALYLFTINSVFIAISSALIIRVFHVKERIYIDNKLAIRLKRLGYLIGIITLVPSTYLAYELVQNELFQSRARIFIDQEIKSNRIFITQTQINPALKKIEVTVIGDYINALKLATIAKRLPFFGLAKAELEVHQQDDRQHIDVTTLKSDLLSDLYTKSQATLDKKEQQIKNLQKLLNTRNEIQKQFNNIPSELYAIFPKVFEIWISEATEWNREDGMSNSPIIILNIRAVPPFTNDEQLRIKKWLKARFKEHQIKLIFF